MLFLSTQESQRWQHLATELIQNQAKPGEVLSCVRKNLEPVFFSYLGILLATRGEIDRGLSWLKAATMLEEVGFFFSSYLVSFLERHKRQLLMPAVVFADPRPYVHFTGVPVMKNARSNFVKAFGHSMPCFNHPLKVMDIGTGDGSMLVSLLTHLLEIGKGRDISEIFLVDASPAMVALAKETMAREFPKAQIQTSVSRIEATASSIKEKYDIAIASLAYHHMPWENKVVHLKQLNKVVDHFVVFELDANNDSPEQNTPEMILSLFQSYGHLFDFVFAHDASIELANMCVDNFLMGELVSFLIHPRGVRTDYHMLKSQWHKLFEQVCAPEYLLLSDATCFADEYFNLFMLHYGR